MDLGTTNSCIAFHDGRKAYVIEQANGDDILPSVVAFKLDPLDIVAGNPAITEGRITPDLCYRHVKRLLGVRWHSQEDQGSQACEGPDGMTWLRGPVVDGRPEGRWAPAEVQAVIIKTLLDAAETHFGERPTRALITVPADFDDPPRRATIEAARIAGLEDVTLLNEPTAAAIAYGAGRSKFARIVVYDWGGGTFDISAIRAGGPRIEVLGSNGNAKLGGSDITRRIVHELRRRWIAMGRPALAENHATSTRLWDAAEEAKIALSTQSKHTVHVQTIANVEGLGFTDLRETLTKQELEEMVSDLVQETIDCCARALEQAGLTKDDVDEVILVGGQTRMPLVQERVAQFFGKKPQTKLSPEKVVVLGAATRAAQLDNRGGDDRFTLSDRSSHSIGIETLDNVLFVVIPRGAPLPASRAVAVTNARDNLSALSVLIRQGEEDRADLNVLLAEEVLTVEPCPAGEVEEVLNFLIDDSGMARVTYGERILYEGAAVE
jgi:molecular chaperone DnaK